MNKLFFVVLFFSFSAFSLDIDLFRESALSHCKKEPSSNLVKDCLIESGETMGKLQSLFRDGELKGVVSLCSGSVAMNTKDSLYNLMNCVVEIEERKKSHPYPFLVGVELLVDDFRAEWVANCFKSVGKSVSGCVQSQQQGFFLFVSDFNAINIDERLELSKVLTCVNLNEIKKTDFSLYKNCRKG